MGEAALVRYEGSYYWDYWLTKDLVIAGPQVNWNVYGEPFTASISLDANSYSPGSTAYSTHQIKDAGGNRLAALSTVVRLYAPASLEPGSAEGPAEVQNHQEVAPFLVVKDPSGKEIYRYKEPEWDSDYLRKNWQYPYLGGGQRFILAPEYKGTFSGGVFMIPQNAVGGRYTASLELGAGREGMVTDEIAFFVKNIGLDPFASSPINSDTVTVNGVSMSGSAVNVYYSYNSSAPILAGKCNAASDGAFSLADIALEGDGR